MHKENRQPRWGLVEIFLVFAGIIGVGVLFSVYSRSMIRQLGLPDTDFSLFVLSFIIQFITTIFLVLLFTVWFNRAGIKELGLKKATRQDLLKYGVAGGILLMTLIVLLGMLINYWQPQIDQQPFEAVLRSVGGLTGFFIMFGMGAIMAPFSEELYFRGMVYPVFRNYLGPLGGALIAGLIFGIAHWDLWRTLPLAVGGALLCYIYEKTDSIWVPMLAHGMWNGIMSMVVYFSVIKI